MSLRRRVAEMQVAAMLLTRLPAGRLRDPVPSLSDARWAYPLVGLPVGLLSWLVFAGSLGAGAPGPVAAMLFLVANAGVTGALHHDGLADFADGIGGGRDRAHCLEIMRDSRIGSYGVLALILALGCQAASLAAAGEALGLLPVLAVAVAGRLAMLAVTFLLPPARADGLGHSAGGQGLSALPAGAVLSAALLFGAGPAAILAALAGLAAVAAVAHAARRRIGGYTGDVLGAALLVFETTAFLVLSGAAA